MPLINNLSLFSKKLEKNLQLNQGKQKEGNNKEPKSIKVTKHPTFLHTPYPHQQSPKSLCTSADASRYVWWPRNSFKYTGQICQH